MNRSIRLLPNVITLGALGCGVFSLTATARGAYPAAGLAILAAGLLDLLDGWTARALHTSNRFGTAMDCVSDFVSFCLAPAFLLHELALGALGVAGWCLCAIYVLAGGFRLARYSIQAGTVERRDFTGLPTTGAALVIASGVAACAAHPAACARLGPAWLGLVLVLAVLMVSRIRYASARAVLAAWRRPAWMLLLPAAALYVALGALLPLALLLLSMAYVLWGLASAIAGWPPTGRHRQGEEIGP